MQVENFEPKCPNLQVASTQTSGSNLIRKPSNNQTESIKNFKPIYTTMAQADAYEGRVCNARYHGRK